MIDTVVAEGPRRLRVTTRLREPTMRITQRVEAVNAGRRLVVTAFDEETPNVDRVVHWRQYRVALWSAEGALLSIVRRLPWFCSNLDLAADGSRITVGMDCEERCPAKRELFSGPPLKYVVEKGIDSWQVAYPKSCRWPVLVGLREESTPRIACMQSRQRWGKIRKRVTVTYSVDGDSVADATRVEYIDDPGVCGGP
jgi:hypothetical protein